MISIRVLNTGETIAVPRESTVQEVIEHIQYQNPCKPLAARVNNRIRELDSKIHMDAQLELIDIRDPDGMRMVQRGLVFLLYIAAKELFPDRQLKVLHSINNALYCELGDWVSDEEIQKLHQRMEALIHQDLPFQKEKMDKLIATKKFMEQGDTDKVSLFRYRKKSTISIYRCGAVPFINYFYGYMVPSTSYLSPFELRTYAQGFLMIHPTAASPRQLPEYQELPKFSQVFLQYQRWGEVLEIDTVADLNEKIAQEKIKEIIWISEALHEKKIALMAEEICNHPGKRLILIAGPSSSGKTSTSKRLELHLKANGRKPITIALDDYFVDREKTPLDEEGNYNFESIDALDLDLFNDHLIRLMNGELVMIPTFNFRLGKRIEESKTLQASPNQPIIVEGIHGLNEKLTRKIPRKKKFKIYVSALTQLSIDYCNRIPTTDTRLLRRIVRDHKFRGHSALRTIQMWPSVRRGEEQYIFPFQEEADVMFSSALSYELSVIRNFAEPLLVQINESQRENTEAKRLLKFLEYFLPITDYEDIPRNSILREFIGGSVLDL